MSLTLTLVARQETVCVGGDGTAENGAALFSRSFPSRSISWSGTDSTALANFWPAARRFGIFVPTVRLASVLAQAFVRRTACFFNSPKNPRERYLHIHLPMKRILLALLLLIPSLRAEDELIAVDQAAGMLTIQHQGTLKTYRLRAFTDITINGTKATVAQLQKGMQVTLGLSDAQTASKVTARGNFAPPAAPGAAGAPVRGAAAPKPKLGDPFNTQMTRKIVFKAMVDAGDNLIIQNGKLHIEHIDWKNPKDISINGIKWTPNWEGKKSDEFVGFVPPLAPFAGANVTVKLAKKVRNNGGVTVLEPPTEANGQKLVVHLQDIGGGASDFEVHITW